MTGRDNLKDVVPVIEKIPVLPRELEVKSELIAIPFLRELHLSTHITVYLVLPEC